MSDSRAPGPEARRAAGLGVDECDDLAQHIPVAVYVDLVGRQVEGAPARREQDAMRFNLGYSLRLPFRTPLLPITYSCF